jgi:hypothetical protein
MNKINDSPIVTITLCVLALIVVIAGGVVTVVQPTTLSFDAYVQDIAIALAGLGLGSGIGRGVIAGAKHANAPPEAPTPPPEQTG